MTNHRQSEGSGIILNGDRILKGQIPLRLDDYKLDVTNEPVDKLRQLVVDALTHDIDFSTTEHQVITPTRKRWTGTAALNAMMQSVYRPEVDGWLELPRHPWAEDKFTMVRNGDKVIWTANDYNVEIMNGESGIVQNVNEDAEEFEIDVGDRVVLVPPIITYESSTGMRSYDPRKSVDLGYAVTTHKAQGSEYTHVIYVLNKSSLWIQNRSNFYTASMRARKMVRVVTDAKSLSHSVWKQTQLLF